MPMQPIVILARLTMAGCTAGLTYARPHRAVAQACARIGQPRAAARRAGAALLPALDTIGGVTTASQSRENAIGRITQAVGAPCGYTEYAAGTQASWEIELLAASDRLATVRAEEARGAVAAYRALGDGWQATLAPALASLSADHG